MSSPPTRLQIVTPDPVAPFIRQDFEFLAGEFDVSMFTYQGVRSLPALRRAVAGSDAVVIWFAGRHAVPAAWWARRRNLPLAIIVGGWEAAWIPEIGYGIPPGSLRRRVLRRLLESADLLLTVSDTTTAGTRSLVPKYSGTMRRIYHGIATDRFVPDPAVERTTVLTVARLSRDSIAVKGLDIFWQVASLVPEHRFVAVGPATDAAGRRLVAARPPNLEWTGLRYGPSLLEEFQRASVYFQGSRHESFSVALAEAMACGCIPVVSRGGALPEVAGDLGVYIEPPTPEAAAAVIRSALTLSGDHRAAARRRIVEHFGAQRRKRELCSAIREMIALHQSGRRPRDNSETI